MSERNEDFVSFEKALRDLKLQSEELKKLVSEGEIRAFRDGQSMKFRREDLENLVTRRHGGEELLFNDELEDDTGMVTEEISQEETLLAEEDTESAPKARSQRREPAEPKRRTARPVVVAAAEQEPKWVTAVAVLCSLVALYGFMVVYAIASEQAPGGITGIFAKG